MKIKIKAAKRIRDSGWFNSLTPAQKAKYLKEHPQSKYNTKDRRSSDRHLEDVAKDEATDAMIDEYLDSLSPEEQERLLSRNRGL